MKNISKSAFLSLEILTPPLAEQQKIADIIGAWDEALEKLDALIAAKAHRKQALMQQLLTGHRRLPGFIKPWKRVELCEVAEECSVRNGQRLDRSRLYAVTKAEGMVPMREHVQGANINRCKIVERGWFAYNPMRINIGSIARWEHDNPVMVSPDYVVFRTNESVLLSDYLNHVRRGTSWADFVGAAGNGSVRIRIWFEDLGYFEFPLPPIEEQRAIAAVLDTADADLRLLRQQRTAFDHQKRGLMQQLLTGRIRVQI
jgi:type I restriction enzyme S subunit